MISKLIRRIRRNVKDFLEITIILTFGLIGLIFIFLAPFEPPEQRSKSLLQRVKALLRRTREALLETLGNKEQESQTI